MKTFLIGFAAVFAVAFPLILFFMWKKKNGCKIKPFIVGAVVFVLFAQLLEGLLHSVCLLGNNSISAFLNSHFIAYALYGGLAAGVFEETGRFIAFKTVLKNSDNIADSVSYGIGHGGIEVILTLGAAYITYLIALIVGPNGGFEAIYSNIDLIPAGMILVAVLERISAMMVHIGLSILVYKAAFGSRIILFPLAILIHALVDVPAVLYQLGYLSIAIVEIIAFVFGLFILLLGIKVYKKQINNE